MNIDIELCAGAGGMAIGLHRAGFNSARFYEIDKHSCDTLRRNITSINPTLNGVVCGEREGDIKEVDWRLVRGAIRLLSAGSPCQPFSLGGKHLAEADGRNLFPDVLRAVREMQPKVVLLENVRGLLRLSFATYFDYILRQIETPSLKPRPGETWQSHDERICKYRRTPGYVPEYDVQWRLCDAADYGIPQNRLRVFIVATRIDLPSYRFPLPTHGRNALIQSMKSDKYWDRHGIRRPDNFTSSLNNFLPYPDDDRLPWVTVRDALAGLPDPVSSEEGAWQNHWSIPGARLYAGHAGSNLDWTAKAIKAGVHGVPGGENTLIERNSTVRYFTLRESARIQTFPDEHFFVGARLHVTRQIGNAAPSSLVETIARPLYALVADQQTERRNIQLIAGGQA